MSIVNNLWIEKYKPRVLQEVIMQNSTKFYGYIEDPSTMRHLLIYSKYHGTGKTILSQILSNMFYPEGTILQYNDFDYRDEKVLLESIATNCMRLRHNDSKNKIILDNFDKLSIETQEKLFALIEKCEDNNLFILVADDVSLVYSKLINICMKLDLSNPSIEHIISYVSNIMANEGFVINGFDVEQFVKQRYPNIKGILLDLQELFISQTMPNKLNINETSDVYLNIYNLISKDKNLEEVNKILWHKDNYINRRYLNKFIWRKAVEESNVRLMQITESNEVKMTNKSDEEIVFDTSLIEMVK